MQSQGDTHSLMMIRSVLVIDDHPLYCDALASTLKRIYQLQTVRTATTLDEALKLVGPRFMPDLVVLDLKLPDVTGLSGFLKIRDRIPDVPVLVVSAISSDETIQALMHAGAAGFVPKDASPKVLQNALTIIREGQKYLPPGYTARPGPSGDVLSACEIARKIADLPPQQARIMRLICAGKPNKQIAYEMSLAEATVKAHITALLRRLGVHNRTQAAILARSAGLDQSPESSDADLRALLS